MLKADNKLCRRCCTTTPHSYVGSKADFEGFGLVRGFMAVISLGITESSLYRDKYWQCQRCGEITRE